jgi:hypothetical protein
VCSALLAPSRRKKNSPVSVIKERWPKAAQLHELKRHNQTPIAPIEMLDTLLSLNLNAKQKRKTFYEVMAWALQRLERKDA